MPTSFKRFAVDFDGDGKKKVADLNYPDLLASTANNLKRDGWHAGASWGYEVSLPARFNFMWRTVQFVSRFMTGKHLA